MGPARVVVGIDGLPSRVVLVEPNRVLEVGARGPEQVGEAAQDEVALAPVFGLPVKREVRLAGDLGCEAGSEVRRLMAGEEHPAAGLDALCEMHVLAGDAHRRQRLDLTHPDLRFASGYTVGSSGGRPSVAAP